MKLTKSAPALFFYCKTEHPCKIQNLRNNNNYSGAIDQFLYPTTYFVQQDFNTKQYEDRPFKHKEKVFEYKMFLTLSK